jgi:hypothetical protein
MRVTAATTGDGMCGAACVVGGANVATRFGIVSNCGCCVRQTRGLRERPGPCCDVSSTSQYKNVIPIPRYDECTNYFLTLSSASWSLPTSAVLAIPRRSPSQGTVCLVGFSHRPRAIASDQTARGASRRRDCLEFELVAPGDVDMDTGASDTTNSALDVMLGSMHPRQATRQQRRSLVKGALAKRRLCSNIEL